MESNVFRRCELKYLLSDKQLAVIKSAIAKNTLPDKYPHSSIRNIYLDTDSYLLARRSIEHPLYKEKLRFRSYGRPSLDDKIFVEIKKKYNSIVYKRRLSIDLNSAENWFIDTCPTFPDTQIGREIDYLRTHYNGIHPAMYLAYERDSFVGGGDLRITLDTSINARLSELTLDSETNGTPILPPGYTLMEIKTLFGYPRWLLEALSVGRILKTTFSKYGAAYKLLVLNKTPEEYLCLSRTENLSGTP